MTITLKYVVYSAVCVSTLLLISNLLSKKYNQSLGNLMSIGACLFILFSNADPGCLCMEGPKETAASKTNSLITGERETDSGDYTQLGTVEEQLSIQKSTSQELQSTMKDCERAASFTRDFAVGAGAMSVPNSPLSSAAMGSSVVAQGLSNSYSSTAVDAGRALEITKDTITSLEGMKPS